MWQCRVWWMGITVLEKSTASSFTLHKEPVDSSKMLLITRSHDVTSHLHCFEKLKSQRHFRHIRTIAKNTYQVHRIRMSVCPPVLGQLTLDWFPRNLVLGTLMQICSEAPSLVKNWTKIADTLCEDLCMLPCWPRHKFATKAIFYATLNIIMLSTVTCTSIIHTESIVAFPLHQWLCKHATMLSYKYTAYLVIYQAEVW